MRSKHGNFFDWVATAQVAFFKHVLTSAGGTSLAVRETATNLSENLLGFSAFDRITTEKHAKVLREVQDSIVSLTDDAPGVARTVAELSALLTQIGGWMLLGPRALAWFFRAWGSWAAGTSTPRLGILELRSGRH
jgi:hypothetical protein